MKKAYIPFCVFIILLVFLAIGLTRNPREIPSPLINKSVPDFSATVLSSPGLKLAKQDMLGKVWLLNVWGSWCASCLEEHPLLLKFAENKIIPIIGLNYKDKNQDANRWLLRYGNPFDIVIADHDGSIGINFGVYGAPESFLIDKQGLIRYKQIGPFTPDIIQNTLLPLIQELQK